MRAAPKPPPPGVSSVNRAPGWTIKTSRGSTGAPLRRTRPVAPGPPPLQSGSGSLEPIRHEGHGDRTVREQQEFEYLPIAAAVQPAAARAASQGATQDAHRSL